MEGKHPMNFTGPKVKQSRALGVALTPKAEKYMKKRPYGPGQHGQRRRRRPSDYGVQLLEKQRLRYQYNVSEKQLQRAYEQATRKSGPTGEILIQLLETRLDALVLRAGLAPTIFAARQLVNHGHVKVNGEKCNIGSRRIKPGETVARRDHETMLQFVTRIEKAAVLRSLENLMTFPFVKNRVQSGDLQLHGAYFGVAEGSLSIVDQTTHEFSRVYQSSLAF